MKIVILLFVMMMSMRAQAGALFGVGASTEFATASDGRSMTTDQPISLQAGWHFNDVDVFGEFSTFSANDGDNAITVARTHYEWLAWMRYAFLKSRVSPYVALGAGMNYDVVQTTLSKQTDQESGSPQFEGAAALGLQLNVWEGLNLRFEMRAKTAGDLAPNPLMGIGAFISWQFN